MRTNGSIYFSTFQYCEAVRWVNLSCVLKTWWNVTVINTFLNHINENTRNRCCFEIFFPGDYYCLGENENRPVRWMAVESLESNVYLHSSDVVRFIGNNNNGTIWESCSKLTVITPERCSDANVFQVLLLTWDKILRISMSLL